MYEPLEKEFNTILKVKDKAVAIALINEHKDFIVNNANLRNFLRTAIFSGNKNVLQALNETKIFESLKIPYNTRVELLSTLANSYQFAYDSKLKLTQGQSDILRLYKNSDSNSLNDDFSRYKSLLQGLVKAQPELITLIKPYYHPENFPSEVAELAKINTVTDNKANVKAAINKAAEDLIANSKLITMLEKANHISSVKNAIDFDFNIYIDKPNEPRFTAERSAIQEFINDHPNKSSNEYNLIKNAAGAANMLFYFVRSVAELQKFQKENNSVEPEKLSPDKLEQLTKILIRIGSSRDEMLVQHQELKKLMTQQPSQDIKKVQETSVPQTFMSAPEQLSPSKPMLRMVNVVSQDVIANMLKAVTDNDKSSFSQLVNNLVNSASPDQLTVTLASLQQTNSKLMKSLASNADPNIREKLVMIQEGIANIKKASQSSQIAHENVQTAPPMTKRL